MERSPTAAAFPDEELCIWKLPGLDKTSFYACALYLHAAAKGQLRDTEEHGQHHEPTTAYIFRDFLDRLADCFAGSKGDDAAAHVTATAMVLNTTAREIIIYVAKNTSDKNLNILTSSSQQATPPTAGKDKQLAQTLVNWFKMLSSAGEDTVKEPVQEDVWKAMRKHNASRIEHYVRKIQGCVEDKAELAQRDTFKSISKVINTCRECASPSPLTGQALDKCARAAWKCRLDVSFQQFRSEIDSILNDEESTTANKEFARIVKWIDYLGRLGYSCQAFRSFCKAEEQKGYQYHIEILDSPPEETWDITPYRDAIGSWSGSLGLDNERHNRKTVEAALNDFDAGRASRRTARVHCEIQLLRHLERMHHSSAKPLDYIGCSKKSCWLCWQLLGHFGKYTTKGTHRMIYPMWAYHPNITRSEVRFATALDATYRDMVKLIQDKALLERDFTSRPNITHTSRRHNQSLISQAAASDHIFPIAPEPLESLSSTEPTSWSRIRDESRVPVFTVPLIYIPSSLTEEDGRNCKPRILHVELFEADRSDALEDIMAGDKDLLFAFQINTKPLGGPVYQELDGYQIETATWLRDKLPLTEGKLYTIYYRRGNGLARNPWLMNEMKDWMGENFREDLIPWFGDVFIHTTTDETAGNPSKETLRRDVAAAIRMYPDVTEFAQTLKRYRPKESLLSHLVEGDEDMMRFKNEELNNLIRCLALVGQDSTNEHIERIVKIMKKESRNLEERKNETLRLIERRRKEMEAIIEVKEQTLKYKTELLNILKSSII